MSLALTVQSVHHDLRTKRLYLIATPTGNYPAGGDTVNLQAITPALGQSDATVGYPGKITNYEVVSAPDGYGALLVKGSTLANWLLQVFSTSNTPIATAAYPAGVLAGVFVIMVEGPKGLI
jgi:hypothetical protein